MIDREFKRVMVGLVLIGLVQALVLLLLRAWLYG